MMDHEVVVREKMTERYLLEELDLSLREEFEEHYFSCSECARDVRAASDFVAYSKTILAEDTSPASVPEPGPTAIDSRRQWFSWLRPAWAVPAFALLLALVVYQNLVTYPALRASLDRPQILPAMSVTLQTWGAAGPALIVPQGKDFLLNLRIPPDPDTSYVHYTAHLYNPAGRLEWSLQIPASAGQDQWPVRVPGARREAGTYKLAVTGTTAAGVSKDVGNTSFELQPQN